MNRNFSALAVLAVPVLGCFAVSCSQHGSHAIAQAPAAPPIVMIGTSSATSVANLGPTGDGTNHWTPGRNLVLLAREEVLPPLPASDIAGRQFTAKVRIQTADANGGNSDSPGPPIQGGTLALDLAWVWESGQRFFTETRQSAVASVTIDAGTRNDKTITFSGSVPAAPMSASGFQTTAIARVILLVNGATTAQGQAAVTLDIRMP